MSCSGVAKILKLNHFISQKASLCMLEIIQTAQNLQSEIVNGENHLFHHRKKSRVRMRQENHLEISSNSRFSYFPFFHSNETLLSAHFRLPISSRECYNIHELDSLNLLNAKQFLLYFSVPGTRRCMWNNKKALWNILSFQIFISTFLSFKKVYTVYLF